jgi:uncharacterized membrane protein YgcG
MRSFFGRIRYISLFFCVFGFLVFYTNAASATCCTMIGNCDSDCVSDSLVEKDITKKYITKEFELHREWLVKEVFEKHVLPALMLFAEQITAMAMHQVMGVGAMMDAKHQLETQRLFQQMMAEAHKSYQPSEGMCTFGTAMRSIAASERNTDLTAMAFSNRVLQRELLSGKALAGGGRSSDYMSRLRQYINVYCTKEDNAQGLKNLCPNGSKQQERINNDINFTTVLDTPLTLKLDFTQEGDTDHSANKASQNISPDEEDLFALAANLYAHNVAPTMPETSLIENNIWNPKGTNAYMNIRSIAAKRSVARNSFAAIAAMKSQGEKEVQPYLYAIMKEFGLSGGDSASGGGSGGGSGGSSGGQDDEIKKYLGERPSYYAQMEILTKKMYQNPIFYTELYDKPANISRKMAAMQAIELMQRRDIYRSMLRSEAILSVMLETALIPQQEALTGPIENLNDDEGLVELPQ